MPDILIKNYIRQLQELQDGSRWFDQSLKDKLENISEAIAFTVPHPAVHSVAEHVSHILEWRKECILRFAGGKTELMNAPNDWIPNATLQKTGWQSLKEQLYQSTHAMIALIEGKQDDYLNTPFRDTEYNYLYLIEGIIEHDVYHLGQIGVTIRLLAKTINLPYNQRNP